LVDGCLGDSVGFFVGGVGLVGLDCVGNIVGLDGDTDGFRLDCLNEVGWVVDAGDMVGCVVDFDSSVGVIDSRVGVIVG
jgi:hypothetical protein